MTTSECAKLLSSRDGFLLLTHKNPDGDTVMSAAALCRALRRKNKKAYLYRNTQITNKMLPFVEKLFAPESFVPKYIVSVDVATENLFPEGFDGRVDFAVDHHPSNSHFAAAELIEAERSACGEIVQKLIVALTGKLTKTEATLLYIALTTDTGAFQYLQPFYVGFRGTESGMIEGADPEFVFLFFFYGYMAGGPVRIVVNVDHCFSDGHGGDQSGRVNGGNRRVFRGIIQLLI